MGKKKKKKAGKKRDDFELQMQGTMEELTSKQWSPMQLNFLGVLDGKSHALLLAGDDEGHGMAIQGTEKELLRTVLSTLNSKTDAGHVLRAAFLLFIELLFEAHCDGRKE